MKHWAGIGIGTGTGLWLLLSIPCVVAPLPPRPLPFGQKPTDQKMRLLQMMHAMPNPSDHDELFDTFGLSPGQRHALSSLWAEGLHPADLAKLVDQSRGHRIYPIAVKTVKERIAREMDSKSDQILFHKLQNSEDPMLVKDLLDVRRRDSRADPEKRRPTDENFWRHWVSQQRPSSLQGLKDRHTNVAPLQEAIHHVEPRHTEARQAHASGLSYESFMTANHVERLRHDTDPTTQSILANIRSRKEPHEDAAWQEIAYRDADVKHHEKQEEKARQRERAMRKAQPPPQRLQEFVTEEARTAKKSEREQQQKREKESTLRYKQEAEEELAEREKYDRDRKAQAEEQRRRQDQKKYEANRKKQAKKKQRRGRGQDAETSPPPSKTQASTPSTLDDRLRALSISRGSPRHAGSQELQPESKVPEGSNLAANPSSGLQSTFETPFGRSRDSTGHQGKSTSSSSASHKQRQDDSLSRESALNRQETSESPSGKTQITSHQEQMINDIWHQLHGGMASQSGGDAIGSSAQHAGHSHDSGDPGSILTSSTAAMHPKQSDKIPSSSQPSTTKASSGIELPYSQAVLHPQPLMQTTALWPRPEVGRSKHASTHFVHPTIARPPFQPLTAVQAEAEADRRQTQAEAEKNKPQTRVLHTSAGHKLVLKEKPNQQP